LRSLVVTGGLHKKETEIRPILMIQSDLSRERRYFALRIATPKTNFTMKRALKTSREALGDGSGRRRHSEAL
jgi:hypothetical protein